MCTRSWFAADEFGLRDALGEAHRRYTRRRHTLPGKDDSLVTVRSLPELIPGWEAFIGEADARDFGDLAHAHASTGRPLGPDSFVESLERRLRRSLKRQEPGSKTQERDRYTRDRFEGPERN